MKINFKATNIELNEQIKKYTVDKLEAVVRSLPAGMADEPFIQADIGKTTSRHKQGEIYRAEFNFHCAGRYFRAEATTGDLYSAIDKAKDELQREIVSGRKKRWTILRRGGRAVKDFVRGATIWPPFRRR